ncbi:hypothetical protein PO909_025454 [Leuciscus waleckii]
MKTMMLQQDVATRWNSTFLMMKSLLDQKRALGVYGADHELPACPFEQLTREISSHQATTADVIPSVVALKRLLSKTADTDSGVRTAKHTLLEAVNERFGSAFSEPLYYLATILDPRYKDRYFDTVTKQAAVKTLQQQVNKMTHSDSATETPDTEEPQEKKIRTSDEGGKSLLDMHDEILEENSTMEQQAGLTSHISVQVHGYLSEPLIPRNESPLQYWKSNMSRFPALAKAARKYLSAPCTSVDSERLFSAASHIVDEKRNRIQCEKAEMLLFVKKKPAFGNEVGLDYNLLHSVRWKPCLFGTFTFE